MYADYSFYTDVFYGTVISEADFPRLSSRASDFLDYYTRGKAAKAEDAATLTALGKACCAVAEEMLADERNRALAAKAASEALSAAGGEIKSETTGTWTTSYTTSTDYVRANVAETLRNVRMGYVYAAQEYLTATGLLYRGGAMPCI